MKKTIVIFACLALLSQMIWAEDHVMAATKPMATPEVPAQLSLSLSEAQDYAVATNRSLRNADLAVQKAYAQRWQTIAAMLPQVDMSWAFQSMMGYEMVLGGMPIAMNDNGTLGVTASVGINGQAIVGALLNSIAIDMQKLNLQQSDRKSTRLNSSHRGSSRMPSSA